jgi:hypothetical protein
MTLDVVLLLCPFTTVSNIFTLKKHTAKQHFNNAMLNVPNNESLPVYQAALAGHWLVMGPKTDSSLVDARLSKMEVAIRNIAFIVAAGNLVIN